MKTSALLFLSLLYSAQAQEAKPLEEKVTFAPPSYAKFKTSEACAEISNPIGEAHHGKFYEDLGTIAADSAYHGKELGEAHDPGKLCFDGKTLKEGI